MRSVPSWAPPSSPTPQVVSDASDRQAYSDDQMARAGLEAGFMKVAYDKLSSDNIEQQRTAAQVSIGNSGGSDLS